jgi:hypothetical protein
MTEIEVPDWVARIADEAGDEFDRTHTMSMYASLADMQRERDRHIITAALGAWVVPQHQAKWIVEQCWEDITPEQFADLEETEAVTRILYDLRQEKPE